MKLTDKNILLVSPERWGKSKVSKHHYALELAKRGNNVYFLNPNSSLFSSEKINQNLFTVDYKEPLRGISYLPQFIQKIYFKYLIKLLEKRINVTIDIIWNFDSSRFYELSIIKDKLKICHIVDMSENFNRKQLAKSSDICFCTSNYILKEIIKDNSNSYIIHHGYQETDTHPDFLLNINKKKINVGFIGNLSRPCIDWDLLMKLFNNSSCDFHLVGGYEKNNLSNTLLNNSIIEKLNKNSNVFLHGEIESNVIPRFLNKMDILIIPYKVRTEEEISQHSSLHKTMEYLGSGKVIISSYQDEYSTKENGLIEMVKSNADFVTLFENVLNNINNYNSEKESRKRIQFALNNTYYKQIERINNILK